MRVISLIREAKTVLTATGWSVTRTDIDPWPAGETVPATAMSFEWLGRTRAYLEARLQKSNPKETIYPKESSDEQ